MRHAALVNHTHLPFLVTKPTCPACASPIPASDLNVEQNTALCRVCGVHTTFAALVHAPISSIYSAPPDGCHLSVTSDVWHASASTHSYITAFFAAFLAIALVMFVLVQSGTSGWSSWLNPCLMSPLILAPAAMLLITGAGRQHISITKDTITVRLAVGPFGFSRVRPLADVAHIGVHYYDRDDASPSRSSAHLLLVAPKPLPFGRLLTPERRNFLHAALAVELRKRRETARESISSPGGEA